MGEHTTGHLARAPKLRCLALGRILSSFSGQAEYQDMSQGWEGGTEPRERLSEPPLAAGSAGESESVEE